MENGNEQTNTEENLSPEKNNEEKKAKKEENGDEQHSKHELNENDKQHDLNTQAQSNFIKIDQSKSQTNNDIVIATSTGVKKKEKSKREKRSQLTCLICNVTFQERSELDHHVLLENHHKSRIGDDSTGNNKHWKHRSPPWIGAQSEYKMCPTFISEGYCRLDVQCSYAHSEAELLEWKERYKLRQVKANKVAQHMKSFSDGLIEKLASGKVNSILASNLPDVDCQCDSNLSIFMTEKGTKSQWIFTLKTKTKQLKNVCLISENVVQQQYKIDLVEEAFENPNGEILETGSYPTKSYVDWVHPDPYNYRQDVSTVQYKVYITFEASIYGTFRQTIVFVFGNEPYLRRDLAVDVKTVEKDSAEDSEKLQELQDLIIQQSERWDATNCTVIDFDPPLHVPPEEDQLLLGKYQMPQPATFKPSRSVIEPLLTKANYKTRMHELLYIEEMAQFEQISQFNVKTKLSIIRHYLLTPTSTNSSTAKYARPGELFGKLTLSGSLSEDTTAGRLILTNCTSMMIMDAKNNIDKANSSSRKAYISGIEDTGKATLYLRLSCSLVSDCQIKEDDEFLAEIQFQMNRLPLCEMHHAIDQLPDMDLVYPNPNPNLQIPWTPGKQWAEDMSSKLNAKQREAIIAITCPLEVPLPPVLMIGPYGTGKTFTLAQAIKILLKQPGNRILVCTHSNSAADLYIRDYLDNFINVNSNIKLLRVYYKNRWVQTVHTTVQKYCLIDDRRTFRNPTKDDVIKCDIVIATLATSRHLSSIGLPIGHFTHILVDEAAQAMECETIMPLALAKPNITRIVMAGDHMQLSPEIFSSFALDRKFNKSLLERLYDLYPVDFRCKILLCENYRSHEVIINYTSELFYEQKLFASGKQSHHEFWHPLSFFTSRGEDVQDTNSTSFYNNSEVYEVVDRVSELQKSWPKSWGYRDENSIGIVTPYYDQVQRIRSELRKRKLFGVSVERVLNVQGKQFRAIFLSTVRTRKTCVSNQEDATADFGFLSNDKLLNTAITRAQSLVAVVGDPVALCSIGKCKRLWERFIDSARRHKSLFGTTWTALRVMLNSCELKKTYVLNPLAPEFVPRARRKREAYLQKMMSNLQAEALRQPNAYAALMQPYLAAQWGATTRAIPPLMGFYPPPPAAFPPHFPVPPFPTNTQADLNLLATGQHPMLPPQHQRIHPIDKKIMKKFVNAEHIEKTKCRDQSKKSRPKPNPDLTDQDTKVEAKTIPSDEDVNLDFDKKIMKKLVNAEHIEKTKCRDRRKKSRHKPNPDLTDQDTKVEAKTIPSDGDVNLDFGKRQIYKKMEEKYCNICEVNLPKPRIASRHYRGNRHEKNLNKFKKKEETESVIIKTSSEKEITETFWQFCEICNLKLRTKKDEAYHYAGKKHAHFSAKFIEEKLKNITSEKSTNNLVTETKKENEIVINDEQSFNNYVNMVLGNTIIKKAKLIQEKVKNITDEKSINNQVTGNMKEDELKNITSEKSTNKQVTETKKEDEIVDKQSSNNDVNMVSGMAACCYEFLHKMENQVTTSTNRNLYTCHVCQEIGTSNHPTRSCPSLTCHECGKSGHAKKHCPKLLVCTRCVQKGHESKGAPRVPERHFLRPNFRVESPTNVPGAAAAMVRSRRPVPIIHPMSNAKVTPAQLANLPPGFVSTAEAFPGLPPPLSPNVPPPPTPPTGSLPPQLQRQPPLTPTNLMKTALVNQTSACSSPQHDSSKNFTFLKDGVHFPHIPSTPPPIIRKDSLQEQRGVYNKLNQSSHHISSRKNVIESAVDVLPHDIELDTFLQSPQLQMAWFTTLTLQKGDQDAKLFKELIVSMQQSSELMESIQTQVRAKRMATLEQQEKLKKSAVAAASATSSTASTTSVKSQQQQQSWLEEPPRPYPLPPSSVLMPSATSADAFYTLANAAVRQHHIQHTVEEEEELSTELRDLSQDPIMNEVLSKNGGSSPSGDSWGSMGSVLGSKSQESIPLYKRRAGAGGGGPNDMMMMASSISPISFPDNSEHASHRFDMSMLNVIDEGMVSTQDRGRSNTLPSSSLSSIWSQQQSPPINNASSPNSRTYANVLRQHDDPLMKIRQLGTKGSQDLSESSSETTSDGVNQPFSPFGAKW